MAVPEHEKLPNTPGKPGRRPDFSGPEQILLRVVKVGKLMHKEGMQLFEIYNWNMEPEQMATGWGYGYRHIHRLVKRARTLGADFLSKSHEQNILTTLMEWVELKRESMLLGDMRAAAYCQKEIAKIRESNSGKSLRGITGIDKGVFNWAKIEHKPENAIDAESSPVT